MEGCRRLVVFSGIRNFQAKSSEVCAKSIIRALRQKGEGWIEEEELVWAAPLGFLNVGKLLEMVLRYFAYPLQGYLAGRRWGEDAVYLIDDHSNSLIALLLPRRAKVLVRVHDLTSLRPLRALPFCPNWQNIIIHVLSVIFKKPGIRRANMVLADSRFTANDVVRYLHVPRNCVRVAHNGLDRAIFRQLDRKEIRRQLGFKDKNWHLMTVTPPTLRKNIPVLLCALTQLRGQGLGVKLEVVGKLDGVSRSMVKKLFLGDCVRVRSRLSLRELVRLYNAVDVYVFPSLFEGFGLPGLEAMACGCPVVSSNATSLPEIFGEAALYFDPADPSALAFQIRRLLKDKQLRDEMRTLGLKQASHYSWNSAAEELLGILDGL